mmetsp:Transcript_41780/g.118493  ORF Transcript_41780/g.118493 Transcript_41780/m.118493 type:complete len:231 (+) Transcript_41780:1029-1721(+)
MPRPVLVDPVNDTSATLLSVTIRSPTVGPSPVSRQNTPAGRPFLSSTRATIFVTATDVSGVVSAPFHTLQLPQTRDMDRFHPRGATGKLKAVMMPTVPSGCQHSINAWPGRSEGKTLPSSCLLMPTARSQMSMNSCTSPIPSALILPISRATNIPRLSRFARNSSPNCLTISPLFGAGMFIHTPLLASIFAKHRSTSSGVADVTLPMTRPVAGLTLVMGGPDPAHCPSPR